MRAYRVEQRGGGKVVLSGAWRRNEDSAKGDMREWVGLVREAGVGIQMVGENGYAFGGNELVIVDKRMNEALYQRGGPTEDGVRI